MGKIYTGIGSRETPPNILEQMRNYATHFSNNRWLLRSGGAPGADTAFEVGHGDPKEIYLPWKNFNRNTSELYELTDEAREIALTYHPKWHRLSFKSKCFHTRNVYQVLGYDLKTPSDMVICWTKDGGASGGTGQALRIAKDYNIPIYNLYNTKDMRELDNYICSWQMEKFT